MNYDRILKELEHADLFEIYRLSIAIDNIVFDPRRNAEIKRKLHKGMQVSFFYADFNKELTAEVVRLDRSYVLLSVAGGGTISVRYGAINLSGQSSAISGGDKITANDVSVGDTVSFIHEGIVLVGIIRRLNKRTASVATETRGRWRVGYGLLRRVHHATDLSARYELIT